MPNARNLRLHVFAPAALIGLLVVAGCQSPSPPAASAPAPSPPAQASLYDRLGGKPAITAVVDDFVANVAADRRINHFFRRANVPHLKAELVDQICAASGGPCTYTGKSMKDAHRGMHITSADFDALVGDLKKSLDKFNVGETEQSQLLGALGPMKGDIVEKG